ncbi:hypothetical protein C366_06019 [Cryptococcus neoformans Tu401-1]|nr:hypothetical protein C366_06019 [Cryptococcus neoformans var. grubii Tu401-1]
MMLLPLPFHLYPFLMIPSLVTSRSLDPLPLLASPCLYPMMLFHLPQVRRLHKVVLKESLWILMMGKAMMTFLLSWWMSLSLKQALRVMEMQMSSMITLVISIANGLPKVPESLIPPYSCWQPSPYQDETIFHTESITRSMPLLATILAIFSIFLTTFVGLSQRFGDMVKAVIQVILELAVTEDRQALCQRVCDKHYLLPRECGKIYCIRNLPVETSSSQLCKNVKTLYGQLDIDPSMVVHPKCPTKECQNVFVDVVGKGRWDKVPNSCPECGTALREGRKLVTEFFPCCTLQAELEYLFSLDGVGQLVKDQQVLCSRQRQCDEQMERLAYLQDANPGKILHHQLDGSCYQVDDQDVQHEHGCLVLTINISINWADPSKSRNHSPRSMGPIITPSVT